MNIPTTSPEPLWFLDTLVTVRIGMDAGSDGISVLEHRARMGDSPPLHVHHTEDEVFIILEGECRFQVDAREFVLGAGGTMIAPKGTPHTYRVESESARWLTVTSKGDFERFVRELSRPAGGPALPPSAGPPGPGDLDRLASTARRHGIELVGPPLQGRMG